MAVGGQDASKGTAPAARPQVGGEVADASLPAGATGAVAPGTDPLREPDLHEPEAIARDPAGAVTTGPAVTGSAEPGETEWTVSDARGPLHTATPAADEPAADQPARDALAPSPLPPSSLPPSSPPPAAPRRSVAGPVFAGLVVGASIGAGSAALVYRFAPAGAGGGAGVAALSARLDALGQRSDPQPAIADLKGSVAALGGGLATLRASVATLQQAKPAAPQGSSQQGSTSQGALQQASPAQGSPAPAFDPAPLQQKIAALQGDVDALRKDGAAAKGDSRDLQGKLDGKLAAVAAALAASQKQAAAAQDGVRDVQGQQKALEGKLNAPALAVVADSLVQQIARGLPYATQVDALAAIGADPARVAVLRQGADHGVPTAKALGDAFEPLADPVAAAGQGTAPGAGFVARVKAGLFSLVSIRRAGDTNGTSAASRVSRIQADLAHDDVGDAYATWQALPEDAKAKSRAWGALAKTQAEAMAAARALQHDAIAALGAKKS